MRLKAKKSFRLSQKRTLRVRKRWRAKRMKGVKRRMKAMKRRRQKQRQATTAVYKLDI